MTTSTPSRKSRVKMPAVRELMLRSREDCAAWIKQLGDRQRDLLRTETAMNDEIAAVTAFYQPRIEELKSEIAAKQTAIQAWAEANRQALTEGGRSKTANFVTGTLQWRQRPPSVTVRGAESVLETLKRLGLARFIRVKEEINKEAILGEPGAVADVPGIAVNVGVEDFIVTPFEQDAV